MVKNKEPPSVGVLRDKDHDVIIHRGNYELYPEMFSMALFYGGSFTPFGGRKYIDGTKVIIDWLNFDTFEVKDLKTVVVEYAKHNPGIQVFSWYKKPGGDLDFDLFSLSTDKDVKNMVRHCKKTRYVEVYLEHGATTIGCNPVDTSNVVLEQGQPSKESPQKAPNFLNNDTGFEGFVYEEGYSTPPHNAIHNDRQFDIVLLDTPPPGFEGLDASKPEKGLDATEAKDGLDTSEAKQTTIEEEFPVDKSDMIQDVEVDMSKFDGTFQRLDVNWIGKGVESGVGELTMGDEVIALDFDEYDSGYDSDPDVSKRKNKIKQLKVEYQSTSNQLYKAPFHLGQSFGSKDQVKVLLKQFAVDTKRDIKMVSNDGRRVRAKCFGQTPSYKGSQKLPVKKKKVGTTKLNKEENLDKGKESQDNLNKGKESQEGETSKGKEAISPKPSCPWTLHVSRNKDTGRWIVQTFEQQHKCLKSRNISAANSTFLSQHVSDTVRTNPDISGEALEDLLSKKFEINVSRMSAYRAKEKAVKKLRGDFHEQFSLLRDYIFELQHRNPGTTVKLDFEQSNVMQFKTRVFRRIYICLGSLKTGFKELGRELIGLDGAFMKGPFPGQVLTAVGVDGNNGIYPVAYALVESECRASWEWFLDCLGDDLELPRNANFTFISDRQKGILQAINNVFPSAEHRFCLRHIHENLKARFKNGGMVEHLWFAATRTTVAEYEAAMLQIQAQDARIYDWLRKIPAHAWSRAHFSGRAKCDILLNNICESFNSKLVKGRDKPIISCLEFIREYLMKRIVLVQEVIDKCPGPLTPTATQILEANMEEAAKYNVIYNGETRYQVSGPWNDQCVVDMAVRNCSCRKWELTGIPCKHVVAVLFNMDKHGYDIGSIEDWVNSIYTLDTWRQVYSHKVEPIVGTTYWAKTNNPIQILPPNYHKQVGRPKKKRKRSENEKDQAIVKGSKLSKKGGTITCGKCKNKGHNARQCRGQSTSASQANQSSQPPASTEGTHQASQEPTQPPVASQSTQSSQACGPSDANLSPITFRCKTKKQKKQI